MLKTIVITLTKRVLLIILVIYFIDLAGLAAWIISDQKPVDSFFVGTINAHLINAILKLICS